MLNDFWVLIIVGYGLLGLFSNDFLVALIALVVIVVRILSRLLDQDLV